jgi:hypothetical protein
MRYQFSWTGSSNGASLAYDNRSRGTNLHSRDTTKVDKERSTYAGEGWNEVRVGCFLTVELLQIMCGNPRFWSGGVPWEKPRPRLPV